jgi:hypothetical protein
VFVPRDRSIETGRSAGDVPVWSRLLQFFS